jgi:hypothetical protein
MLKWLPYGQSCRSKQFLQIVAKPKFVRSPGIQEFIIMLRVSNSIFVCVYQSLILFFTLNLSINFIFTLLLKGRHS